MADLLDVLTLPEAKQAIGQSIGRTVDDVLLSSYITLVSRRLDQLCGPIVKRPVVDTFDGGMTYVLLRKRPVAAITSVAEGGATLDPASYMLRPSGLLQRVSGTALSIWGLSWIGYGIGSVVVSYTAGRYDTTALVQEPFRRVAAMLVAHVWRGQHGLASDNFGAPGEEYSGLPGFFIPNIIRGMLGDEIQAGIGIA